MEVGDFKDLNGLSDEVTELFAAVGVEDLKSLARSEEGSLLEELEQANRHLKIMGKVPSKVVVGKWLKKAREITGEESQAVEVIRLEVGDSVESLEVFAALPVDKKYIVEHEIAVSEVPVMEDFIEASDLVETTQIKSQSVKKEAIGGRNIAPRGMMKEAKPETEVEKVKLPEVSEETLENGLKRSGVEPLKRSREFDIRKTASPELNEGKKMHSRRYVRGVLHPQPFRVKLAALVSFFTMLLFPAAVIAPGIFLLDNSRLWLLAIPAVFVIFGFFYLTLAKPLKCRICGQPLLSRKACGKHMKAHRVPFLGYILPTSLHMLLFHWFRCIYCGTSVRLKR